MFNSRSPAPWVAISPKHLISEQALGSEETGDLAPIEFMPRKFVKEISSFKLST